MAEPREAVAKEAAVVAAAEEAMMAVLARMAAAAAAPTVVEATGLTNPAAGIGIHFVRPRGAQRPAARAMLPTAGAHEATAYYFWIGRYPLNVEIRRYHSDTIASE